MTPMQCSLCTRYAPRDAEGGECRARPPVPFMLAVNAAGLDGKTGLKVNFPAAFPSVVASSWCAEFVPCTGN